MIRALIVDDEPLARRSVASLLESETDVALIGECASGGEAIARIRADRPDLVLLDVEMPDGDGFEVLEALGSDLPSAVVFVTAYDRYALRAFEAGAIDYLLKPFDRTRFAKVLARAREWIGQEKSRDRRLAVKSAGQVLLVKVSEIDWIEAADYYASLHVAGRTHLLRRSLADLEGELGAQGFCRVHRSALVNLDRVRGLVNDEEGDYLVELADGTRLRLSRSHRKQVQERLGL
jgi:two-component system LytT family response regulator